MKLLLRLTTFALVLFITPTLAHAQLTDSGDLAELVENLVDDMPGSDSDEYELPTALERNSWESMLEQLFAGNLTTAAEQADALDYDLTLFLDLPTGNTYQVLTNNGNNFWGTYIFYPQFCRNLVVQSPHPRRDLNTGRQGLHVFRESESLAFMMSGTHRCNSNANSSCSGTTTVCSGGSSQAYPVSDLAHHTANIFQRTTEFLLLQYTDSYFISLHGFTKGASDPYLIMSNGTRETPNPDYIDILAQALQAEDPVLNTEAAHLNLSWTRLIGFTNVQGRLINDSADACEENAVMTEGRFLHVEQEKTRLRDNLAGWNKMANAIIATFPCMPVGVEQPARPLQIEVYPNPSTGHIRVRSSEPLATELLQLYNALGENVTARVEGSSVDPFSTTFELSGLPVGLYYLHFGNGITQIILQR